MTKPDKNRDSKGDMKYPKITDDFYKRHNWWSSTYIFQYWDRKIEYHRNYFEIVEFDEVSLTKARALPGFVEKALYKSSDTPPYDQYIQHSNWQLSLMIKYFKEVFEDRSLQMGVHPEHKYFRIILPKKLHDEITECISNYGLQRIQDLIFEIIAIAQNEYVEHIVFWERPDNQKIVTSAKEESKKVIELIQRSEDKPWKSKPSKKQRAELLYINFVYNNGTIKLTHPWLAKGFITHTMNHYNDLLFKDWRKELERYPDTFEENRYKNQFKYRLSISIYNMLSKEGFISSPHGKTSNRLLECVACIVEFCLIPVGEEEDVLSVKVKHIRNWIKRNTLHTIPTHFSIEADRRKLSQYFGKDFIGLASKVKSTKSVLIGTHLAKRFDLKNLLPEFIHIAQCLINNKFQSGFSFIGIPDQADRFEEQKAFKLLIDSIKNRNKISGLSFTIDGDQTIHTLSEKLPIHLIERALFEYMNNNREEFESDLISTTITPQKDGSYLQANSGTFNLPSERFLVRFIVSFYRYLLAVSPPEENEHLPSEKYYAMIAIMLKETWYFFRKDAPDWTFIEKVKKYHSIGIAPKE